MIKKLLLLAALLVAPIAHAASISVWVPGGDLSTSTTATNQIIANGAIDLSGAKVTGILPLGSGGLGTPLVDPGADRILFWDDSGNVVNWLSVDGTLDITGTAIGVNGANLTGIPWTALSGVAYTDITALWTVGPACDSTNFLRGDGSCIGAGGGGLGSVTSVGLSMPTGFSVSGSPVTTAGTLTVTTVLNGVLYGNGSGFTTATSGNVISLWSGTCNSGTFLRGDGQCQNPTASPGGSNTQVQFNNGGAFAGSAGLTWSGTVLAATQFSGDGSAIFSIDASNISSGTLTDGRLSSNVPLKNAANVFTTTQTLTAASATWIANSTSAAPKFQISNNGTRMGFLAGALTTNDYCNGAVAGDVCVGASAGNIIFTTNDGGTTPMRFSTGGNLTITGGSVNAATASFITSGSGIGLTVGSNTSNSRILRFVWDSNPRGDIGSADGVLSGGAATDLALSSYVGGALRFGTNNGVDRGGISSAGNWSMNAPSSGRVLTIINDHLASDAVAFVDGATRTWLMGPGTGVGTDSFTLLYDSNRGAIVMAASNTGNVSIPAPVSGIALNVGGSVAAYNQLITRIISNDGVNTQLNDGLYIGYNNGNSGATRLYGGGDTATPIVITTGGRLTAPGALVSSSTVQSSTGGALNSGVTTEIGISSGIPYIQAYNWGSSLYQPLEVFTSALRVRPSGGSAVDVCLANGTGCPGGSAKFAAARVNGTSLCSVSNGLNITNPCTRNSAGNYSLSFGGYFSSYSHCTGTIDGNGSPIAFIQISLASPPAGISVFTTNSSGTATDGNFFITCIGS